jgi:chromosome segregation ATPase
VRTVASDWEAEVSTVRAENREVRTWLREAQSQQSRAEERAREAEQMAKEADELKAALAAKVAAVATAEEELRQERTACQKAEGQLQQERAALADARSALEWERTALERTKKSLEEWDAEVSRFDGELIALSISNADQQRSLEEQGATIVSLQQAVETERRALEVEKKQVEGELPLHFFVLLIFPSWVRSPSDFLCSHHPSLRTALGHATNRAETLQDAYNSSEQ